MRWPGWLTPPSVTAIDVPIGSNAGGETFKLTGSGFARFAQTPVVDFGGTPATGVVVVDDRHLTCVSPAKPQSATAYNVGVTCGGVRAQLVAAWYSIPDYVEFWWPDFGITLAAGVVQSWTGRKGAAATQAVGALRPGYPANYNGSPFHALSGSGTQWLTEATTVTAQPLTVAYVGDGAAGATLQFPWGNGAGGGLITLILNDVGQPNKQQVYAGTAGAYQGFPSVYAPGVQIFNFSNSASDVWYENGLPHSLITARGSQGFTSGVSLLASGAGGAPLVGNLAAWLLFNSVLGATDAGIVNAALKAQFGTP